MPPQSVPTTQTLTLLALALQGLAVEDSLSARLQDQLPSHTDEAAAQAARAKLLKLAATPEARLTLAEELGCTYADLTKWVSWCDLRRLESIDWSLAQALAKAGVVGVRDLAAWTLPDDRRPALLKHLATQHPSLTDTALLNWGRAAARLPALIIADTTVIVVVKGAGEQKPEQTLGEFIGGFWPAIYHLDPSATLTQRHDVLPDQFISTPYERNPLNLVAEIRTGERRIWVREPNWDAACVPEGALTALNKEWRMATYALVSWIQEYFAEDDTRLRDEPPALAKNFWRNLAANTCLNWAVFLHATLALTWSFGQHGRLGQLALLLLLLVIPAVALAVVPAWQAADRKKKSVQGEPLEAFPGMVNFGLVVLLVAFVISPWGYLLWVCAGATILLAYLRARAIAWPSRREFDSDERPAKYYSVQGKTDPLTGRPKIHRRPNRTGLTRLIPWRWYIWQYRYLIILGLPITFLALLLARFLKWTRVLGIIGEFLEAAFSRVLSGGLGDLVTYAMDPAKANSIRHVIQSDLQFFHDLPYVSKLHVFAHSQGTPITFETLFNHLPVAYTEKIQTYVTIGSVLDYYHQTNPILDPIYIKRFPVRHYRAFAPNFRWVNFWNLTDPITEFCGLEDYPLVKSAPLLRLGPKGHPVLTPDPDVLDDADLRKDKPKLAAREAELAAATEFYPNGPTSIKSPAGVKNHSEYWSNQECVHGPLARRVLGDLNPAAWDRSKFDLLTPLIPHNWQVALLSGACLLAWGVPLIWLVLQVWPNGAFQGPIANETARIIEGLLSWLKITDVWHALWWPIHDWAVGWLRYFSPTLEAIRPNLAPVPPSAAEPTPWPARFLSELLMILLTAAGYFGLLYLLNAFYTWVTSWFRPKPKPAAPPSA